MSLLNLPPADGSGSSGGSSYGTLDGLAERMDRRKKKRDDDEAAKRKQEADQQRKDKDADKEKERKAAEDRAKSKGLPERIASGIVDIFSANTEGDKRRRQEVGQAIEYGDQQADKKKTVTDFKISTKESFENGTKLEYNKQADVDERRLHFKANGLDIDQFIADQKAYNDFKAKNKGKSLAKLTLEGKIPQAVTRYEKNVGTAQDAERSFQRDKTAQAGAEGVVGQLERGFTRGFAEPIVEIPSTLKTAAGAVTEAVAPEGSRLERAGTSLSQGAATDRQMLAAKFKSRGYAPSANDNPLASGVGQGVGSLAASILAAQAGGLTAAAGLMGANQGADQTIAARKSGKLDDTGVLAVGVSSGIFEGVLEKFGLEKFLGASGGIVRETATRMISEGVQEALQSLAQSGVQAAYSDVDLGQAMQQATAEGGLGAIVGGGAGFSMSIAQQLEERGVPSAKATEIGMNVADRVKLVADEAKHGDTPPPKPEEDIAPHTPEKPGIPEVSKNEAKLGPLDKPAEDELLGAEDVEQTPPETFDTPAVGRRKAVTQDVTDKVSDYLKQAQHASPTAAARYDAKARQLAIQHGLDTEKDFDAKTFAYKAAREPSETQEVPVPAKPDKAVGKITTPVRPKEPTGKPEPKAKEAPKPVEPELIDTRSRKQKLYDLVSGRDYTDDIKTQKEIDYDTNRELKLDAANNTNTRAVIDNYAGLAKRRQARGEKLTADDLEYIALSDELDRMADSRATTKSMKNNLKKQLDALDKAGPVTTARPPSRAERRAAKQESRKKIAEVDARLKQYKAERKAAGGAPVTTAVAGEGEEASDAKATASKPVKTEVSKPVKESKRTAKESVRTDTLAALVDESSGRETMRSAAELTKLADLLNKAAQGGKILRRGDLKSKKAYGMFQPKGGEKKTPIVKLQDAVIKDPKMYATVLAHELSHAIEFTVIGNNKNTLKLFGDLSSSQREQITNELKNIVDFIEGQAVAQAKPKYYYMPTEMMARLIETMVLHPGKAEAIAPLAMDRLGDLIVNEPLVADLFSALDGSLDKGFKNYTADWFKDLRQVYRKHLGKRVGDLAYNAELIRRANLNRSEQLIARLIKNKFKGIKDEPAALFRAAEAILVTELDEPTFGTHDFMDAFSDKEYKDLESAGWTRLEPTEHDGKEGYAYTRERYTPEQAKQLFEALSPEGQQLIKDFTAAKEEAKDEFNRELMKELYNIDSKLEGWVHHFFEGKPMAGNSKAGLRAKVAGAKKQRKGADGYIEDFQKATTKALLEMDRADINNSFIRDQLARISKPIAKGEKPDDGWVEVQADEKGGLRLPGEGGVVIIETDGKSHKVPPKRYQVPRELAEHYREIRDLPKEANKAALYLNRAAKYWTLNVLIHPGSTTTNFISGALQYGGKLLNDFYMDALTANFSFDRTRNNLIAPLKTLTPKGWAAAPDWLYGGYRSTLVGSYSNGNDTKFDRGLDAYGDKALKVFSLVETYWKKTIALSEGSNLKGASTRRIIDRLHQDEEAMIAALNESIDTYAFDYDNKPLWMSKFDRKGGKLAKPFMTYPYKLTKFYASHVASAFDRTLPWQERTAKVLTLATIVAFIAMYYNDREDQQKTPEGTEKTPLSLKPGGRLFVMNAKDGKELFIRTAKYPFFNLTSLGKAAVDRNGTEVLDLLNEQFGTVGPGMDLFMLATGRRDQFSQYTPPSVLVANQVTSWLPGFRILQDVGNTIDEQQRTPQTFVQGIGSALPIWGSEDTRAELRGKARTIKIPDETDDGRSIAGSARTVTAKNVTRESGYTLLSLLTGVYVRPIDPKDAHKQELREIRDDAEEEIRTLLVKGQEQDAATMGEEYGLEIPDSVYRYYRAKRNKAK